MVHGVSPSMPSGNFPPPNNPQLNQWADKVRQFIDQNPDGAKSMLFSQVLQELLAYKNGDKQFKSIQDVLNDVQTKFLNGSGQLDVYASSGLGNAQSVQDFAKIFGVSLSPPTPTAMDNMIMKFQQEVESGLPTGKGADALLAQLHDAMMKYGSNDMAGFQKELKNIQGSDYFKNCKNQDAIDLFKSFIQNR
jgi:hypothetical protein